MVLMQFPLASTTEYRHFLTADLENRDDHFLRSRLMYMLLGVQLPQTLDLSILAMHHIQYDHGKWI